MVQQDKNGRWYVAGTVKKWVKKEQAEEYAKVVSAPLKKRWFKK